MSLAYLSEFGLNNFIRLALAEDVGEGDFSSEACIPEDKKARAVLLMKADGIVAGLNLAEKILLLLDPELQFKARTMDGKRAKKGDCLFEATGNARALLKGERLLLNCMQRMSGIATYTRSMVNLIAHTSAVLLDTRKTTPNFRIMEKWAVVIGGGRNHRYDLSEMIMLKDNHIDICGSISSAIAQANAFREQKQQHIPIIVEARNLQEVEEILKTKGADRILLDNMSPRQVAEAVEVIGEQCKTEASGGIDEELIVQYAEAGVDFISVGALTHSHGSLDMSMKIKFINE